MSIKIGAGIARMHKLARRTGGIVSDQDVMLGSSKAKMATWVPSTPPAKKELAATEMMSATWRMNTVRWIDSNFPSIARAHGKGAPERLVGALVAAKYRFAEYEGEATEEEVITRIHDAVREWSKAHHDDFVSFIEKGGYKTRRMELDKMAKEDEDTLMSIEGSDETASVEVNGPGADPVVPRAKVTAGRDDGSSVEEAVQYGSQFAGSW